MKIKKINLIMKMKADNNQRNYKVFFNNKMH